VTFDNDEFDEKMRYTEQKYHALIRRMGASQEDIDCIEEEIMLENGATQNSAVVKGRQRRRGSSSYANRKSRVSGVPSQAKARGGKIS